MEIGRIQRGNALTQEVKVSGNKKDFPKVLIKLETGVRKNSLSSLLMI